MARRPQRSSYDRSAYSTKRSQRRAQRAGGRHRKGADPVGVEAMRRIILDYLSSEQGIAEMAEIGLTSNEISGEEAYQRLMAEIDTFKMIKDKFY